MSIKHVLGYVFIALLGATLGRFSHTFWPAKLVANPSTAFASPSVQTPRTVSGTQTPSSTKTNVDVVPAPKYLNAGEVGRDGGLTIQLDGFAEVTALPGRRGATIAAQDNAKLVAVRIKFKNDGMESADIHCSFHLGSKLYDKDGRQFDHIRRLYDIEGNNGCNDNIQPGFGSNEIIAFELPASFVPDHVKFWDPREKIGEINDGLGERTAIRFRLAK